ncbi:MAG: hypothetical protein JRC68_01045 [Deltaproteobacteria bacterium]|nr:hypothetical protein [Deltaproteobacteria bacterium]
MADTAKDLKLSELLSRLAGVEEKHKERLFDLSPTLDPTVTDKEAFESGIVSDVMEGGHYYRGVYSPSR